MTKWCNKCGRQKPIAGFYVMKRNKDGLQSKCKECEREYKELNIEHRKEYDKKRYWDNREKDMERSRQYRIEHRAENSVKRREARERDPEKLRQQKRNDYARNRDSYLRRAKIYYQENADACKERIRAWEEANRERSNDTKRRHERRKLAANPGFKLSRCMGRSIKLSLAGRKNGARWESIVGYTTTELMVHIEKQFKPGMTWENQGKWHVDHVIPQSWFTFATASDDGFKDCWALMNLQPLWARDNYIKGNRRTEFPLFARR